VCATIKVEHGKGMQYQLGKLNIILYMLYSLCYGTAKVGQEFWSIWAHLLTAVNSCTSCTVAIRPLAQFALSLLSRSLILHLIIKVHLTLVLVWEEFHI